MHPLLGRGAATLSRQRPASVLASSLLCLLVLVAPAQATYPGKNGKIAFGADRVIASVNADGTGLTPLTTQEAACRFDAWPHWSADGQRLAFHATRAFCNDLTVFTMNADGSALARLPGSARGDRTPAWSPDGSKIVFSASGGCDCVHSDVHVMNVDGSGLIRLTSWSLPDTSPEWSPDGTRIVWYRGDGHDIWTMNPDGSGKVQLTFGPWAVEDRDPSWSPDGRKILFASDRDGDYELYVMNADGSEPIALTHDSAPAAVTDWQPAWSPDGTKIVWSRDGDLWLMDADGTSAHPLDAPGGAPVRGYGADWQPIPGPNRGAYANAARFCKAEQDFWGEQFASRYGGGKNAFGKCVSSD